MPVAYEDLIGWALKALNVNEFDTELKSVEFVRGGAQMFGTWTVTSPDITGDDYSRVLGIRSSYDKTLPCGIVMGLQVMVCSNLMFSGDTKTVRRQTKGVYGDLPWEIHKMVERYLLSTHTDVEFMESLKEVEGRRHKVNDFVVESMKADVIPSSHIKRVLDEWKAPTYEAFAEHREDLYGLHNAYTHVLKKVNPTSIVQRNARLVEQMKKAWPVLNTA